MICNTCFHLTEEYACEDESDSVSLSCVEEVGVIDVLSALYGRAVNGSVLCLHDDIHTTQFTQCTVESDTAIVKGRSAAWVSVYG